ncbi:MAG: Isoquinoline 1-oxidoreductase, partial [Rhodospirillales bacterium]|nr:Isoquinoline 1-oxidoreductase [Rhodospirillales bacterium]
MGTITRRGFVAGGAITVAFARSARVWAQQAGGGEGGAGPKVVAPGLPGSLKSAPSLDSWIRIGGDG